MPSFPSRASPFVDSGHADGATFAVCVCLSVCLSNFPGAVTNYSHQGVKQSIWASLVLFPRIAKDGAGPVLISSHMVQISWPRDATIIKGSHLPRILASDNHTGFFDFCREVGWI